MHVGSQFPTPCTLFAERFLYFDMMHACSRYFTRLLKSDPTHCHACLLLIRKSKSHAHTCTILESKTLIRVFLQHIISKWFFHIWMTTVPSLAFGIKTTAVENIRRERTWNTLGNETYGLWTNFTTSHADSHTITDNLSLLETGKYSYTYYDLERSWAGWRNLVELT